MIFDARSSSRRCTIVTVLPKRVRKVASSTAADDQDVLVLEEEPVAGRAPGHATAGEPLLVLDAELTVGGPGREDHRAGAHGHAAAGDDGLDRAGQVELGGVVPQHLGAEALGLLAHGLHEVGAHDAGGEPGEVLDLGGVHQRTAGGHGTGHHEGLETGARGVDRRGVPGRSGSDDDDVADGGLGHDGSSGSGADRLSGEQIVGDVCSSGGVDLRRPSGR
jgi:hypothetical protein